MGESKSKYKKEEINKDKDNIRGIDQEKVKDKERTRIFLVNKNIFPKLNHKDRINNILRGKEIHRKDISRNWIQEKLIHKNKDKDKKTGISAHKNIDKNKKVEIDKDKELDNGKDKSKNIKIGKSNNEINLKSISELRKKKMMVLLSMMRKMMLIGWSNFIKWQENDKNKKYSLKEINKKLWSPQPIKLWAKILSVQGGEDKNKSKTGEENKNKEEENWKKESEKKKEKNKILETCLK